MSHYSDNLTLSLFPGVGLLDKAFEAEGFSVVRGPDLIFGGDVRGFHVPAGRFDLVIGGSPCQDFSIARRSEPTGEGVELLGHFVRLVEEAQPAAFLLENVPHVPDVQIAGYQVQRFDLRASECGGKQARLRHFQFGSRRGLILQIERQPRPGHVEPAALAAVPLCRFSIGYYEETPDGPDEIKLSGRSRAEFVKVIRFLYKLTENE